MKEGSFDVLSKNKDIPESIINKNKENEGLSKEESAFKSEIEKYTRIPFSENDMKLSVKEISEKYGVTKWNGYWMKKNGYRVIENPNYHSKTKERENETQELEKFLKEVTPLEIRSVETIWTDTKEQGLIREMLSLYDRYKYWKGEKSTNVDSKRFRIINGKELSFGDLYILDKMVDLKPLRDNKTGYLMVFDKSINGYRKFKHTDFTTNSTYTFSLKDVNKKGNISLETFAPYIAQMGILNEKDFSRHKFGNPSYDIHGAHDRYIQKNGQVALSNRNSVSRYYLGRDKFVGTNEKINRENTKVILLDNTTAGIIENVHGKKNILYTFSLIDKNTYEDKKREAIEKRKRNGQSLEDFNPNDFVGTTPVLEKYSISKIINKNQSESNEDYIERISQYSDLSYILDGFRDFMSETGLAANNYSWKEQLILSDSLTSVKDKEKIISFSKKFGKDGLKTFLSVEQGGKEMGNKIIELSQSKILHEELIKNIFEGYSTLLEEADKLKEKMSSIKEIEGVNSELVEKIPHQVHEALLLRTKDILVGSSMLAEKGELNGLSAMDVKDATDGITMMLKILNDLSQGENFSFKELNRTEQNFKYEITDKKTGYKYGLKIFLRSRAEKNAQARVNIELSFDTDNANEKFQRAFLNRIESHTQGKVMNGSVLRIGIDREERNGGQVSLDIGRSAHQDEALTRTGDILGNLLAVASTEGNHTTESFDPRFAEEENFAQIVKLFENYLVGQKNS